jgi:magnesium transporter
MADSGGSRMSTEEELRRNQSATTDVPYTPPPDLVYRGEREASPSRVRVYDFSVGELREVEAKTIDDIVPFLNTPALTWIDWVGLQDIALLNAVCGKLSVHPLHVEDLVHTDQRPKVEECEEYLLVFVRRPYRPSPNERLSSDQIALILTDTTLVSVREQDLGLFSPVQSRLRLSKGRIRSMGCDYLAYSLLDAVTDCYFAVLDAQEGEIEEVQDAVLASPEPSLMARLHAIRSDLLVARKSMWPLREVVAAVGRSSLITPEAAPFLRDAYEHTLKIADTLEFARDMLNATMESYMTAASNRMNETIRLLTVISLVFMPLTFIVGVYGMNFRHMPELSWRYGYAATWVVMISVAVAMIVHFRRKKWM